MLKGIAAAPGVVMGKAFLLGSEEFIIPKRKIPKDDLSKEVRRFEEALIKTRAELLEIQRKIKDETGFDHWEIFDAHLLILEDKMLIEEIISRLKKEQLGVECILFEVFKKYASVFSEMEDSYLKERVSDIEDVGRRVLRNLQGIQRETLRDLKEKVVVVAHDLSPSDTALLHKGNVIAFITDIGGRTSHTAIMAKSLEIPAVVGLKTATREIKNGDLLIVDGINGVVEVNPDDVTSRKYKENKAKFEKTEKDLSKLKDLPAQTLDGHKVELAANIELPEEIPSVIARGAEGIGLYRTEYFYMNRTDLPTEDEHYEAYKQVALQMSPHSIVIRTLDLGGDKFLSHLNIPHEMNPYLGWRGIRFCLAKPDIFKAQLKAILRASVHGKLKLMYPMISGIEELRQANQMLEETKEELRRKHISFDENMEVGIMIEVPSAALTCDLLAKETDFFSIGTNDLIQYSLAVDRANERIAYLYEPTHPAVLRLIKNIIDTGHQQGIWVGMCGEMAGEPTFALLLLGLGLDEFSVSPSAVPDVKKVIRSIVLSHAQEVAQNSLALSTGKEVEAFAKKKLREFIPELTE